MCFHIKTSFVILSLYPQGVAPKLTYLTYLFFSHKKLHRILSLRLLDYVFYILAHTQRFVFVPMRYYDDIRLINPVEFVSCVCTYWKQLDEVLKVFFLNETFYNNHYIYTFELHLQYLLSWFGLSCSLGIFLCFFTAICKLTLFSAHCSVLWRGF